MKEHLEELKNEIKEELLSVTEAKKDANKNESMDWWMNAGQSAAYADCVKRIEKLIKKIESLS